jgi:molybdopterin/thiamine biosynthesis adenylyltransferase
MSSHTQNMTDDQLLRYSRHILLDEIGIEGQENIINSHVLIIGAGGLGAPVVQYLVAAGVGQITLVDHDQVDLTNLQRQVIHTTATVGMNKVDSAALAAKAINPEVQFNALATRADAALLQNLVAQATVVVDCTDNFATRHAINSACVKAKKPLVCGAVIRFDGQITVVDPRQEGTPCWACVFPPEQTTEETRCATMGVFSPLVGVMGSIQATEALKIAAGLPSRLVGRLLLLDGRSMSWTDIQIPKNPHCSVCHSDETESPKR